ncbi:MAG: DEAD/DEAH box helicase [Acidobacteriota bacterium]
MPAPRGGLFFLWGETSSPRRSHRERAREAPFHPFHCSRHQVQEEILRDMVDNGGPSTLDADSARAEAVFLLPSANARPVPSPELVTEDALPGTRRRLAGWRIQGVGLLPLTALGWLAGLPSRAAPSPSHVRPGADVRFWAAAARFALELLARQRFLPDVETQRRGRKAAAKWEPLLEDGQDRLERLAASMPPVCRAFLWGRGGPMEPHALLESFFSTCVDAFIRQAASRLHLRPRFVDTAGARFAAALLESRGDLAESAPVLRFLEEELREWKRRLEEEKKEAPYRIAFRLEAPLEAIPDEEESGTEAWTLRFFLQAVDDPSLLVPLSEIWQHSGPTWRYLNRRLDQPHERVLEGLGRASSLFPPIEQSLKHSHPEYCRLDVTEAYRFLRESAFLLQESGFGVLVPSWWQSQESRFGLRLRVAPTRDPATGGAGVGMDALLEFDWQVALGEESLDRDEFLKLVELKRPLVRVRGRWVELQSRQVEEVLSVIRAHPSRAEMSFREVLQVGLGRKAAGRLPVVGLEAERWVKDLFEQLTGSEPVPELPPPRSFQGKLRPYQVSGLAWLDFLGRWGLGACLADDMGLGKTIQVLALLLHRQGEQRLPFPFLLICPTSVVSNWKKEAERFAPSLRVLIHHGLGRREGQAFVKEAARHDLVVSTYSLVHRDLERLRAVTWGGLVLDEAQNVKNPSAKQTQALRRLGAPVRIALTGTPVENRLSDLWSIMEVLNPGYLGSQLSFKRRFSVPIERYRNTEATDELRRLVGPFVLRRLKTDPRVIKDLPEKNEMRVYCNLTPEQATLYEAVVRESLSCIEQREGLGRKGAVLTALTRLKQVCNHPAHYLGDGSRLHGRSGKLSRLTEMLEEILAEGDCALVFTQFAQMGRLLQRHLREALSSEVLYLHGAVPARQRDELIHRFQEDPAGPPVFILSLKAGGFGLNLTRALHVFHFDRWWNPAVEDQATDRVFRIGQTQSVAVHKYICAGTVEERIDELIQQKKAVAEMVIRVGEGWLTELSTAELRDLFALRRDAVQD